MSAKEYNQLCWFSLLVFSLIISSTVCLAQSTWDGSGVGRDSVVPDIPKRPPSTGGDHWHVTRPKQPRPAATKVQRQTQVSRPAAPFVPDPGAVMALGVIEAALQGMLSSPEVDTAALQLQQEEAIQRQVEAAVQRRLDEAAAAERQRQKQARDRQAAREWLNSIDKGTDNRNSVVRSLKSYDPVQPTHQLMGQVPELGKEKQQFLDYSTGPQSPDSPPILKPCGFVEELREKAGEFIQEKSLERIAEASGTTSLYEQIQKAQANLERLRNAAQNLTQSGFEGANKAAGVLGSSRMDDAGVGQDLDDQLYKNADNVKKAAGEGVKSELGW